MKIQVLGTGCPKCKRLYENASNAMNEIGNSCEIEKIEDIQKITEMGVMMTPALAIDNEVISVGKVLDVENIVKIINSKI